jgi:hypothetical protein
MEDYGGLWRIMEDYGGLLRDSSVPECTAKSALIRLERFREV